MKLDFSKLNITEKLNQINRKATVEAFKAGEEANEAGKKAAKLERKPDKTKEEEELIRELRKQNEIARERQNAMNHMARRTGLGEQILRAYFTYKMTSLACNTLIAMSGVQRVASNAIGKGFTDSVDGITGAIADKLTGKEEAAAGKEIMDAQERHAAHARQIEDCLESFERMSDEAERLGITEPGKPLLTDKEREGIKSLADVARDPSMSPEDYAQKCADLGLDYNEAYKAAQADKDIDRDRSLDESKDRDRGREPNDPGLSMV